VQNNQLQFHDYVLKLQHYILHITSGAIYPGVPLVSDEFSGFQILAIPRSVNLKYPFVLWLFYHYYQILSFQVLNLYEGYPTDVSNPKL